MTAITFDTLKFAHKLKSAGILPEHAEAEAEALADIFEINLKPGRVGNVFLSTHTTHNCIARTQTQTIQSFTGLGGFYLCHLGVFGGQNRIVHLTSQVATT